MKSLRLKKHLKKIKKNLVPKFKLGKLTKKVTLNFDKTYKKLSNKKKKVKKHKDISTI